MNILAIKKSNQNIWSKKNRPESLYSSLLAQMTNFRRKIAKSLEKVWNNEGKILKGPEDLVDHVLNEQGTG